MKKAPSSLLLFAEAQRRGYEPTWLTEYGFFMFMAEGKQVYCYQTKSFGNTQMGSWMTHDKHALRVFLDVHSLPSIPYFFSTNKKELHAFFSKYHQVIGKPVYGEKASQVVLLTQYEKALELPLATTIFEEYREGNEYRVLLLRGEVVAMQEKTLNPTEQHPWKKDIKNLRLDVVKNEFLELILVAKKAQQLLGQQILTVDFIKSHSGSIAILELNSMPGLWSLEHPDTGEPAAVVSMILDVLIESQLL